MLEVTAPLDRFVSLNHRCYVTAFGLLIFVLITSLLVYISIIRKDKDFAKPYILKRKSRKHPQLSSLVEIEKVFYLCDTSSIETNALLIKKVLPKSTVFVNSSIDSVIPDELLELKIRSKIWDALTRKVKEEDVVNKKVDYFILSAKLIYDNPNIVTDFRNRYGHPDSEVIAVSFEENFLKMADPLVDYTSMKDIFFNEVNLENFFLEIL